MLRDEKQSENEQKKETHQQTNIWTEKTEFMFKIILKNICLNDWN